MPRISAGASHEWQRAGFVPAPDQDLPISGPLRLTQVITESERSPPSSLQARARGTPILRSVGGGTHRLEACSGRPDMQGAHPGGGAGLVCGASRSYWPAWAMWSSTLMWQAAAAETG
jgi:hypothetical protein